MGFEDFIKFVIKINKISLQILKEIEVLITNFIKPSKPNFNVYYILQYLHLDVR